MANSNLDKLLRGGGNDRSDLLQIYGKNIEIAEKIVDEIKRLDKSRSKFKGEVVDQLLAIGHEVLDNNQRLQSIIQRQTRRDD